MPPLFDASFWFAGELSERRRRPFPHVKREWNGMAQSAAREIEQNS